MVELLYTRVILVLAGLGLVSMGVGGVAAIAKGYYGAGILSLLLAVGIGYLWIRDWQKIGKCANALQTVNTIASKLTTTEK